MRFVYFGLSSFMRVFSNIFIMIFLQRKERKHRTSVFVMEVNRELDSYDDVKGNFGLVFVFWKSSKSLICYGFVYSSSAAFMVPSGKSPPFIINDEARSVYISEHVHTHLCSALGSCRSLAQHNKSFSCDERHDQNIIEHHE